MYELTVPVSLASPSFDAEKYVPVLHKLGAARVLIALPTLTTDNSALYPKLEQALRAFSQAGLKCGVWYWAFMVKDADFTPVTGINGPCAENRCPADEAFLRFAEEHIRKIAALGPELILFDDDLRFGHIESGYGCICPHHKRRIAALMKCAPDDLPADLYAAFTGGPNLLRTAMLTAWGESLKTFCARMRAAVDSVDPAVRIGICSCMSVWDTDGVDTYTLAQILAGGTRPYIRLIGAPYWGALKAWGNRLQDVIELERMERSWYPGGNAEIVSEGDVFPRPRYAVPASYLDIFDTALRFSGGFSGIQKYVLDYTSSVGYETGYTALPGNDYLDELTAGTESVGIRVYERMQKLADADLTGDVRTVPDLFFSDAARMLACNGLPTVWQGTGCGGVAFGENVKDLPPTAFEKPLVTDLPGALYLQAQGHDLGLAAVGAPFEMGYEYFREDGEYVCLASPAAPKDMHVRCASVKDGVQILSEFVTDDGRLPACWRKGLFTVLAFDAPPETVWRNYMRARQLRRAFPDLPVCADGNPDLYVQARASDGVLVVGLWNCHADAVRGLRLRLRDSYAAAEGRGASVRLTADGAEVEFLAAFSYCFLKFYQTERGNDRVS